MPNPTKGKNIAIFCDGTWQYLDQQYPTNVALLARCVAPNDEAGTPQIVYYDDGVGVTQGISGNATQLLGGTLGQGLDYKIAHAYQFLCLNYEPGDRIFIFGFSRGAYTARSLGGLLRWAWILKRQNASMAGQAMALYRSRPVSGAGATEEQAFENTVAGFRQANCYPSNPFTGVKQYDPEDPRSLTPDDAACAWVQYEGVWDTVGSLGIPDNLPLANVVNAQNQFHDTDLSRFVRSARHAVSIDERRSTFKPTLWTNIGGLNLNAGPNLFAYELQPYQQQWFPGGHGSVGGGGPDHGLSLTPMLWIAEGASRAGLILDEIQLQTYSSMAHPDAPFQADTFSLGSIILQAVGMADRAGPALYDEVSLAARLRYSRVGYRPPPLARVAEVAKALSDFKPQSDPQTYFNP